MISRHRWTRWRWVESDVDSFHIYLLCSFAGQLLACSLTDEQLVNCADVNYFWLQPPSLEVRQSTTEHQRKWSQRSSRRNQRSERPHGWSCCDDVVDERWSNSYGRWHFWWIIQWFSSTKHLNSGNRSLLQFSFYSNNKNDHFNSFSFSESKSSHSFMLYKRNRFAPSVGNGLYAPPHPPP